MVVNRLYYQVAAAGAMSGGGDEVETEQAGGEVRAMVGEGEGRGGRE